MTRFAMAALVLAAGCGVQEGVGSDVASVQAALDGEHGNSGSELAPNGRNGKVWRDAGRTSRTTNISYHRGPVMTGQTGVYVIWYGNWAGNTATTIVSDFLGNLGGSPYFAINTTYYDVSNVHVQNVVNVLGSTSVGYPYGTSLTDANIQQIVANSISSNTFPASTNAVYFVLTSADVTASSGFCTQYCGWHNHGTIAGLDVKYSFVGNPDRCPASCAAQTVSPNGNAGADGMASIIAHELEETVTDPDLNAWYDSKGAENADKCAWTFGTTTTLPSGAKTNVHLGARDYLIQQNWNATTQACGMHL